MNSQSQYKDEIDIIDYIKIVYKRRRMVMAIVIITMLSTGIYFLCQPKLYEASATFFPLDTNYDIQSEGFTVRPKLEIKDLIVAILQSRKMSDRIVEQLDLKKVARVGSSTDAQKSLKMATKVAVNSKGIIKLSVQTQSPELSAIIANAYVDNLEYFNSQLDIGAQRQIVQVIDRAIVPEKRMPRGTTVKTMQAGLISFMFAACITFFLEFIQKSDIKKSLKEK